MSQGKCPIMHGGMTNKGKTNTHWWPNSLKLEMMYDTDMSQAVYLKKSEYKNLLNITELITVSGETSKLTVLSNLREKLKETTNYLNTKKKDLDVLNKKIGNK